MGGMQLALFALELFGGFRVTQDGNLVNAFESNKVRGLLAYLAVEADRPHQRSALAGLLWPDQDEQLARTNLRHVLRQLRQSLADHQAPVPLLLVTQQSIQINPAADLALDTARFSALVAACERCPHEAVENCAACIERYSEAAALYQGPFLAGLDLHDSELFDEWAALQRERLHRLALEVYFTLASCHERRGAYERARQYAWRQIELEPWREEAHRQLMRVLTLSGQRSAALAQYAQCRAILADELGVEPDSETTALYEQIRAGALGPRTNSAALGSDLSTASLPRNAAPALHNLPAPLTPLVGRKSELAAICARLREPAVRLLTLTGAGGSGKTRLALQAAAELTDRFADGICFVDLSTVSDPALVPIVIGKALQVKEHEGVPLSESLKAYLRPRQLLLLLDNFEQVAAAAPLIVELLRAAPALTVLVTSRTALRLSGEHQFVVSPLELPHTRPLPPLAELAEYEAVRLFEERARAVRPDFTLSAANAPAVVAICRRLDGLPLAIELAAARVRTLEPKALLARMADPQGGSPLQLLTARARDLPARQQTLRRTIEWSYQLLDGPLQTLFARLAVFVGGFTLEAAEAVCGQPHAGEEAPPLPVLDGLEALLDQSLLRQERGADGAPRFRMLETIREYARERLADGDADAFRRRHATCYLALAEAAEQLRGTEPQLWLERLDTELDNLRAAVEWALAHDNEGLGLRLAGVLATFWYHRGYWSEGRARLKAALDCPGAPKQARAKALLHMGELEAAQNYYAAAQTWYEQSLACFRELGDTAGVAGALSALGLLAREQGDAERAAALFARSLELFRRLGDETAIAWSLCSQGEVAVMLGDTPRARALLDASLAHFRQHDDHLGAAWALNHLGHLAQLEGDPRRATELHTESLSLFEQRDRLGVAWALNGLAEAALDQGDPATAKARFVECLALFRELGSKQGIAWCLAGLAGVAAANGSHPAEDRQAARLWGAAEALRKALGTRPGPGAFSDAARQAAVRARLDAPTFARCWSEGRSLPLDQALAEALEVTG